MTKEQSKNKINYEILIRFLRTLELIRVKDGRKDWESESHSSTKILSLSKRYLTVFFKYFFYFFYGFLSLSQAYCLISNY